MKKTLLLVIIAFAAFGKNFAQDKKPSFLTLTMGPGFPMGDFAKKGFENDAGLAKTGAFLDLSYADPLTQNFGFIIGLRGRLNGIDLSSGLPRGTTEASSTVWRLLVLSGGFYNQFPLNKAKSFLLEIKGLGGIQTIASPELKVKVNFSGLGYVTRRADSYTATSFSYLFGTGLAYHFKGIGIKLFMDYVGSTPEFKDVYTQDIYGKPNWTSVKQEVRILDLGAGLVVFL